ncbi:MAG TPA: sulfur oxidation c-type cytochrome SoxA [Gammaproteobacteria bacterium]
MRGVIAMLLALLAGAPNHPAAAGELKSGYAYIGAETQAMQDDEFANPGMPTVERGEKLFRQIGQNGQSCASCHGDNGERLSKAGIARYPVFDAVLKKPVTLQERINMCWEDRMDEIPYVYDCTELVALETYVRHLAKGEPVKVDASGVLKPYFEAGKVLYNTRFGQTNLACVHCHDDHAGQYLRGQLLSQGHSNGFPEYRLGSGKVTSLHGRFSECFRAFRAEPFEAGSPEYINLEIYLNARGNGLPIETPAVRY